jgi:arylsulfatase A-like enzyme
MRGIVYLAAAASVAVALGARPAAAADKKSCKLDNRIEHIVYIQFDNVHFRRDNPNVPSDLEQIPNLLNFLEDNGTLFTNHHTPLISHTSVDILTSLTGVYGDKFGVPIGNNIGLFGSNGVASFPSSFTYWTDVLADNTPEMLAPNGKNAPAPWVPFTRTGCDVGAFSIANIDFENVSSDINTVFGPNSPQAMEAASNHDKAVADFEGIIIHCAQNSPLCGKNSAPDLLADEPGGYDGFTALYGNANVQPQISPSGPVKDLDGNIIADSHGNNGFPGFSPAASQTLGYLATMLEAGVPVVYGYIADAHDNRGPALSGISTSVEETFGPGEAGYVTQLKAYDKAFGEFFARLAKDGITKDNTLFMITADENDHFAGGPPSPANCDGVTTPCTYALKGEIDADLSEVYATEFNNVTPFRVHSDDAPTFYINGNPSQTDTKTRTLEQQAAAMLGFDITVGPNGSVNQVTQALADQAEQALLHMITADPNRTPNFILFGNPDYFLSASGSTATCTPMFDAASCFAEEAGFAWNHGDFQPQITNTWLGMVGPGVRELGTFGEVFSDHTDIRPTILSLVGLKDDYAHDGRVLFEVLADHATPRALRAHQDTLSDLAEAYKQINAPLGELGLQTLIGISTDALKGDDGIYATLEAQIKAITAKRNEIAGTMIEMLENAAFKDQPINEAKAKQLIDQAFDLLDSIP